MNELPANQELARKIVMGAIEDSLQYVNNDRLKEETYIFWDKITCACDYEQLRNIYFNIDKFVNPSDKI